MLGIFCCIGLLCLSESIESKGSFGLTLTIELKFGFGVPSIPTGRLWLADSLPLLLCTILLKKDNGLGRFSLNGLNPWGLLVVNDVAPLGNTALGLGEVGVQARGTENRGSLSDVRMTSPRNRARRYWYGSTISPGRTCLGSNTYFFGGGRRLMKGLKLVTGGDINGRKAPMEMGIPRAVVFLIRKGIGFDFLSTLKNESTSLTSPGLGLVEPCSGT